MVTGNTATILRFYSSTLGKWSFCDYSANGSVDTRTTTLPSLLKLHLEHRRTWGLVYLCQFLLEKVVLGLRVMLKAEFGHNTNALQKKIKEHQKTITRDISCQSEITARIENSFFIHSYLLFNALLAYTCSPWSFRKNPTSSD